MSIKVNIHSCNEFQIYTFNFIFTENDGEITEWNTWTNCSKECHGIRVRTRDCPTSLPPDSMQRCKEKSHEWETCNDMVENCTCELLV